MRRLAACAAVVIGVAGIGVSVARADSPTIAGAPTIAPGQEYSGTLPDVSEVDGAPFCPSSYWLVPATAGEEMTVSWTSSSYVWLFAFPPGTTDESVDSTIPLAGSSLDMTQLAFRVPSPGSVPLQFNSCQAGSPYSFNVQTGGRPMVAKIASLPSTQTGVATVNLTAPDGTPLGSGITVILEISVDGGAWTTIGQGTSTDGLASVSYTIPAADLGEAVSFRVVGSGANYATTTSTAETITAVVGSSTGGPSVSKGTPNTGGWSPPILHGAGPLGSSATSGADNANEQFVFWKGTNGTLWDEWYTHRTWQGPAQITTAGDTLESSPAVAVLPDGQQDVFWKGPGGNLWETTHTSTWTKRVDLGAGPMGSGPTAGADAHGGVYVFWEGTDGSLWDRWQLNGTWHGPAKITTAGKMGSAPGVAVEPSGVQNVFWRGRDGDLWDTWHTNAWHGPVNLGAGPMGSAPTAGSDGEGNLFVFWEGTDGSLWDRWDLNGTWHGPAKITTAGKMGSPPTVAVQRDGEQDVFWRGTDGNLWETWHP